MCLKSGIIIERNLMWPSFSVSLVWTVLTGVWPVCWVNEQMHAKNLLNGERLWETAKREKYWIICCLSEFMWNESLNCL